MLIKKYAHILILSVVLIPTLSIVSKAHAESVVWSGLQPSLVAPGSSGPDRTTQFLRDPMVSVTYNVLVSEVDASGNELRILPSGSTVPMGTKVKYQFIPHEYTDIYWFGTGNTWDSPYGDWISGAGAPPRDDRCAPKNHYDTFKLSGKDFKLFAALSIDFPIKSVTVNNATCSTSGINKDCILTATGTTEAVFNFEPTSGMFYPGFYANGAGLKNASQGGNRCAKTSESYGYTNPMKKTKTPDQNTGHQTSGDFVMQVPKQVISHTLVVSNATDQNDIPGNLFVSAVGGGSCIIGTPYSIQMHASDPNNVPIRYGIDWDNNGSVDQFVPPSGYVASGTTQTASRTYTTPGTKTVRVFAQNQDGLVSASTTFSFICATHVNQDPDEEYEDIIIPDIDDLGDIGDVALGTIDLSIRAIPSLVSFGQTTKIHWSADHVVSCQVSAANGDSWLGLESPIGGEESSDITTETIYTLRCLDAQDEEHTATARVNVLPRWEEF